MSPHRGIPFWLIPVSCLVAAAALAEQAPEKAAKYHEALLKRPHNAALFDRFFGAWIDEQPVEALGAFLKARAQGDGGQNWTVLATYELRRGNEEEALAALAKAIEALPDDPALPMERAKLRLRRLEFDGARADLAKAAAGKDEVLALEAAKLTGKSWLREGRTEEAIKAWDAVLAAHPNDEDLLEDLVETAAAESETAQALVYAGKLIEVSRDPYQKTLRMLRRGDLLAQAGKNDVAVEAYAGILNQVGEGSWLEREVLAQIEKVFRKQDRLDDLSAQLKKLAEIYPQRLLIHRQLAKLEAAQGETDAAIGRFREVLKRSPGERELREEFVRLLIDGERFDDAVAELEKLIEINPADSGLYLQVAALRSRQTKPEAVLAALKRAHELLGKDEGNGIRIAGLMLQYGLIEPGESLLKGLAGPAAMEALAAQYGRTGRKAEAIELLKMAGAGDEVEVLLRTSGAISGLGESATAFEILTARAEKFSSEPRFLAALTQAALAAGKPAEAVPQALKLVRLAKQAGELAESIGIASRVIAGAEKADEVRCILTAQAARTPAETCLLASLLESISDFIGVGKLLELDPDPLVIRFHAALLDRRGDFEQAIAVISRLANTGEGRKAAYFKDLSELQQRAGRMIDALATVERWKLAAPGDKSAWITGSRLLRESGKPEEAVKMTRQAVGRFEGDADLAASLAALHDEAGQWHEAEAIYWKLYDEGQSPAEQARWAAQLAQLAQRTGKIGELEDKLRERARGNRRSIGPILALAELARVANKEDKRRELLLEALRLQPKDLDLRLQVALLEEQFGNPERVIPLLEEALAFDVGERVRRALAQTYLRQGQAVKGLRELRMLSGKSGFDPRSAEVAAASLAGSKLYDEAIGFLRTELPDGGDWRTRYLLAVLLEEDGRETEALPLFLDVLRAEGDITGLAAPTGRAVRDAYPEPLMAMFRLQSANGLAYVHRNRHGAQRAGYGAGPMVGIFSLPTTPEDARQFALVHLGELSKQETGAAEESIRKQIKAAGIDNLDFVTDLAAVPPGKGLVKLLEIHPDEPGLFDCLMEVAGPNSDAGIDVQLIRQILERPGANLSPSSRFAGWSLLTREAKPEDPAWTSMLAAARDSIGERSPGMAARPLSRLLDLLRSRQGECPVIHRPAVKQLLLDHLAATAKARPEDVHNGTALAVLALAGTQEAWLAELNATIRESRKIRKPAPPGTVAPAPQGTVAPAQATPGTWTFTASGGTSAGGLPTRSDLPTLDTLPIRSIPMAVLRQIEIVNAYQGTPVLSVFGPGSLFEELVRRSGDIESPLLRAWLALKVGNKDAIVKAMAVEPPPEEAADFELLRAVVFLQENQRAEAFASLVKAQSGAGSNREQVGAINFSLAAVVKRMTPEERASLTEEHQVTIRQLAKRIESSVRMAGKGGGGAIGPAAMAATRRTSSSYPGNSTGSPDKVRKFVSEKKFEAAAREVLLGIRSRSPEDLQEYYRQVLPDLAVMLGRNGRARLLELVDPGASKSLLKRLEYVDVCDAMGKPELALGTLEAIARDRPDDAAIAARLAFKLPIDQMDRRIQLMNVACKSAGFGTDVTAAAARMRERMDNKVSLDFFETITCWLETLDPQAASNVDLNWVSYHAKGFFLGEYTAGLPTLFASEKPANADSELIDRQRAICGRLARVMMRHGPCAEEGFRLLASAKAWKLDHAEMDDCARQALLALATSEGVGRSPRNTSSGFFVLASARGGSSGGLSLMEFSSAAWLVQRMKEVASPSTAFPAEYIAALTARNPAVGDFMAILSRDVKDEDLTMLWNSEVMKARGSRLAQMLRPLMLKQMALAPAASKFFAEEISRIPSGSVVNGYGNGGSETGEMLFATALIVAAKGAPGELDTMAHSICRAVFGESPDFASAGMNEAIHTKVNFMESLGRKMADEPVAAVRMYSAFFRLGVSLGRSEAVAAVPFENRHFTKADEAETFLESLGWLAEPDRWEPYAVLICRQESKDGKETTILQPRLALAEALRTLRNDSCAGELVKRLKDRKSGRFGSLMVAAALSSESERSELAGQAFTEFAADLEKLPPERVATFSLFLPWLPGHVGNKLPEKFQHKQRELDAGKRAEVVAMADKFVDSMKTRGGEISINRVQPVVASLIPYDIDKAVEIFTAADDEFTESLGRGGKFSNSSSGEFQIAERDRTFGRITQYNGDERGPFASDPALRLKFLTKILASSSGKRLIFGDLDEYTRSVFATAVLPLFKVGVNGVRDQDMNIRIAKAFKALEPGLKPLALPCFVLTDIQSYGNLNPKQIRAMLPQLAAEAAGDPQLGRLMTARLVSSEGVWQTYTPAEKAETRAVLTGLITDESIPDAVRLTMAMRFIVCLPKDERLDPAFCMALARLYQTYCGGERSAVSVVSERLFKALADTQGRDESTLALDLALARTFWENATTAKVAGHPPLPATLAQPLFMSILRGKDMELAAKIFPRIKEGMAGKLSLVVYLMELGRFDLARQLASRPGHSFQLEPLPSGYTRKIEELLAAFKQAGVDKPMMQDLELSLLVYAEGTAAEAPAESREARVERVIGDFAAAPTDGSLFQVTFKNLFTQWPRNPKLLALLDGWARANPVSVFLTGDSYYGVGLHGLAAMHALARGDSSLLKAIIEAMPTGTGNLQIKENLVAMVSEMSRAVWLDVCAGTTAGYQAGLPLWNEFIVKFAEQIASEDPSGINHGLAASHFLACWVGEPATFDAMCGRLPENMAESVKQFSTEAGLLRFIEILQEKDYFYGLPDTVSTAVFLEKAMSQPGFASYFQKHPRWLDSLAQHDVFKWVINPLSAKPPAGLIPEVSPALYLHYGKMMRKGQQGEGIAVLRKGIGLCPVGPAWNIPRGDLKLELCNQLRTANQLDEARKVLATIPAEEVSEAMKELRADLAKTLEPTPEP
ncbi:MAG: tetratricopeptide repeat protein [Verrucomicrobiota bacterium]